jgi:hypothetical protein
MKKMTSCCVKDGLDALLPDEDPQEFKDFRDDLLEELKPQTRYQHMHCAQSPWMRKPLSKSLKP